MKKVFVLIANGFEIVETMTPVDILKRCGIEVTTISIYDKITSVHSSQDIKISTDTSIDCMTEAELKSSDLLFLPGGYPGFVELGKDIRSMELAKYYLENTDKYLAAVCGTPSVLNKAGLLNNKTVTAHSSVKSELTNSIVSDKGIVIDKNLITSTGVAEALKFSLTISEILVGKEVVEKVKKDINLVETN